MEEEQTVYQIRTRVISMLLSVILLFNLTTPALAVMQDQKQAPSMILTDKDGNPIENSQSWEEEFPYGTFAFESSQLATKEGSAAQTIKVYRLGGTKGKAQLTLSLSPVVTQLDDGAYSFATAAGVNDYVIEVEDMLPIAAYQPFGFEMLPQAPAEPVAVVAESATENTVDEAGEPVWGNTILRADIEADSYQWQGLTASGAWVDLDDCTDQTLDVSNEALEVSDFRCVYAADGVLFCTDSFGGIPYVEEQNEAIDIPEDLDRNPAQSFHTLDLSEGEFDTYEFYMTFAEGEWVKEIRITPINDEISENVELFTLTIDACKGGELYDTANTLLVSIEDNDEVLPSFFSLETTSLTVDKASGSALLTVKRTGALQYVATVDYHTVDGTARAGVDYADTSGTLYFASDMEEAVIEIPLINDGVAVPPEQADKTFSVVLEHPTGGGPDTAITGSGQAVVSLYNTGETIDPNLATMLYTPEADDVSGSVQTTAGAIAPGVNETVVAEPAQALEEAPVEVVFGTPEGEDDEVQLLQYDASAYLNLKRSNLPTSLYWDNYADLGGMESWSATNNTQKLAYQGWDDNNQVSLQSDGYFGRRVEDIGGGNDRFSRWNYQKISQLFTRAQGQYRADTDYNWLGTFWSTAWGGIANQYFGSGNKNNWAEGDGISDTSRSVNLVRIVGHEAGWIKNYSYWFNVKKGDQGMFISLGIEDKGGADTGSPNGEVYQKARGERRYLNSPLKYYVHTADDNALTANQKTALYSNIAPKVSVVQGKGGVTSAGKVYVGTEFSLSKPLWSSYAYANNTAVFLSKAGDTANRYNSGSVASNGTASLQLMGGGSNSFASGGNLDVNTQYAVNVILNRRQNIKIDISPSVPRAQGGQSIDPGKIGSASDTFWSRATIRVNGAQNKSGVTFTPTTTTATKNNFSSVDSSATISSSTTFDNIRSINFGLPKEDQILFNGVQYNGNEDIPIPISMFGMNTLAFTYYHEDYVSVESDMKLIITRVEHYVDLNGNGQLDGTLNRENNFDLKEVKGVKDVLVRTMDAEEYAITEFWPLVDENGKTVQQFLKFYYNMTPRCLTVPVRDDASEDDRAQILPAFVTSVTDASQKAALSTEMQGYRFITSGKHSHGYPIYDNAGNKVGDKVAGTYSGDDKFMYTAKANATESVDFALGGDFSPIAPTYVYQKQGSQTKTSHEAPSVFLEKSENEGYALSDITYRREDWKPDYHGNLLYEFQDPTAIFVSDSLVGENLPVAPLVEAGNNANGGKDKYDVSALNGYLGSFNPLDTVSLCIRPQTMKTDEIHSAFDVDAQAVSTFDAIQSGEHTIEVDSSNAAGFKTVPDASGLRRTTAGDKDVEQGADTSASSNSMPEFNVDLGVELPSLSVGLTDFVTLITDGSEFGFSIGIPVFKAEKSKSAYTTSDELYGSTKPAYGKTETSFSESVGNLKKVKDAFANPGKLINSEEWKAAKNAKAKALDSDKLVKSKGFEFSVAFNVTVMFKYSPTDNTYHFSSAMVFLQFGFQFKVTARLTVCPIVYAYFVVGASLKLAGGVINEREVVENTNALIDVNDADDILGMGVSNSDYTSGKALRIAPNLTKGGNASSWSDEPDDTARGKALLKGDKGDAFTFVSKSDAVNLYFSGKVKVELKTGEDWNNLGYVASDGKSPVLVMFDEKVDGVADQEVRITVLDEAASFDTIAPISSVRNETFFSGLSLTPAIFLEVGAGIGVEVLKVEIYLKASIGCSMAFATRENNAATKGSQLRDPSSSSLSLMGASASVTSLDDSVSALGDDKVTPFSFNSMTFRAGFGVRVVLILFNFELDVVQFGIDYSKEQVGKGEDGFKKNGWKFAWYVLNGGETIKSYDLSGVDDSDGFPGIKITLPSNTFTAQQIFGPENAKMVVDEISAFAFDPENLDDNEFQISGYSSSRDAFRLATGLATGTDYELLTVGQDNYLLYTISRENPQNPVDSNMLVLSKIQNTGENVGLAHPATGSTESGKNYLAVDDDDTGDLDFSGNATGDTIHVSWVSYETETPAAGDAGGAAAMPTQARPFYESGLFKVYMDKDNYEDEKFTPKEPSKPAPVVEEPADSLPDPAPTEPSGDEVTTMPDEADYYVTAEVYDTLDEDGKAKYSATSETGDETNYHVAIGYNNYNEAKAVYDEKAELYEQWQSWREYEALKGQWDKYNDYISSDAYQQYEADYQQYEDDLSIYEDWFNYFNGEREAADTAQSQLAASAKNTVVKTAFFQVVPADQMSDDNASTFSEPKVIGANSEDADGSDGYKFLPAVSADGKLTFYARTNNYSEEEKQAATARAQEFYKASRGDVSTDSEGVSSGEGDPTAAFRYAYSTSMDDVYGKNTAFLFSYTKDDGTVVTTGFTPTGWDQGPGTRLSSASMVMLDDSTFYLAYTATQTQTVVDDDSYGDMSVHKLYLQMGTIDAETGEVSLEPAKMLRQLVDVNDYGHGVNSALVTGLNGVVTGQDINQPYDGVYVNRDNSGATMLDHFEDPYFGVVRFLRGDLGSLSGEEENFAESLQFKALDASSSLFMLFEMNGTTYVVPESSLKTITATEGDKAGKGMIIPFFTPSEDNRTRGNMSIGADGEGRIAAVYTDTMPNTTNNALFVSTYDPATASFGEGRMLAMNYMQVYEDSIAAGWSPQDTEQAYYGKLAGYNATEDDPSGKPGNKQGGMTSFTFSNLAVALGLKKTVEPATVSSLSGGTEPQNGKRERPVVAFNAGEPPKAIENSTLVILTQGTRTELTQTPFLGDGSSTLIVPKTNDDGSIVSSTGFYALSFGVGTKNVGEASITFEEPTFVPGAQLRPIVSFKNTGDVPLSASPTQPMTVELWISAQPETGEEGVTYGTGEHLFTWKITQNIAVGQSVSTTLDVKDGSIISTDSYTAKLPTDLEGRKFYFTVREFAGEEGSDAPAIDNPFNYSSMADEKGVTRTIEAKPELAIENLVFKTLGVDETGDNVRVAVSMDVTNRGTKDAVAPYLQFAYQTGRTMEEVSPGDTDYQKAVYGALDLTGSNFTVNRQEIISALSGDSDASRGVLRLIDKDGNSNIDQNHKRFVEGELLISKDAYCEATATGSLNLKVTVFEEGDVITALSSTGLQTSNFDNEYSGSNNVGFKELEPMSFFTAPTKITLPMNTALRISLPVTTTTKQPPVITVSELNIQAVETQEKRLGILYYDMGASGTGKDGYLVLQPTA